MRNYGVATAQERATQACTSTQNTPEQHCADQLNTKDLSTTAGVGNAKLDGCELGGSHVAKQRAQDLGDDVDGQAVSRELRQLHGCAEGLAREDSDEGEGWVVVGAAHVCAQVDDDSVGDARAHDAVGRTLAGGGQAVCERQGGCKRHEQGAGKLLHCRSHSTKGGGTAAALHHLAPKLVLVGDAVPGGSSKRAKHRRQLKRSERG